MGQHDIYIITFFINLLSTPQDNEKNIVNTEDN